MTGIEEYPDLDGLEQNIRNAFEESVAEAARENSDQADVFESLTLEDIVIIGEWGHGNGDKQVDSIQGMLYADIEGKNEFGISAPLSQSEVFNQISDEIMERFYPNLDADQTMREWFTGPEFGMLSADVYSDSILFFINQAQPNRVYDITRRAIVTEGPQGPSFEPTEQREVEEVTRDVGGGDILDYPNLEGLTNNLNNAFEIARELELEEATTAQEDVIRNLFIDRYTVVGEWGQGTGIQGEDQLQIVASMNVQGSIPTRVTFFDRAANNVADRMEEVLEPTDLMQEWFSGTSISAEASNFFEEGTINRLDRQEEPRAVDISERNILRLEEGELDVIPVAREEPEVEEEEAAEEVPEEALELQELADEFPTVPTELLFYARQTTEGAVAEIPAGKETKQVTPREPYGFEREMYSPGGADTEVSDVMGGIGISIASQRFGEQDPPGTFPRTGVYIRNYLLHRGPAYVLQMYNSLVIYSGYISSIHGGQFRPGEYSSFRRMIHQLMTFSRDETTPTLIRRLSPDEATTRDLKVMSELPNGTDAPWLEPRNYYEIVEENKDHEAWFNIVGAVSMMKES